MSEAMAIPEHPKVNTGTAVEARRHAAPMKRADAIQRFRPSARRRNILSYLATGWLPWGVPWTRLPDGRGCLIWSGWDYPVCCGHVVKPREAQDMVCAGLVEAGPAIEQRPTLVITKAGREWLTAVWPPA